MENNQPKPEANRPPRPPRKPGARSGGNRPAGKPGNKPAGNNANNSGRSSSRGAAMRAQKRNQDDAHKAISQYITTIQPEEKPKANQITDNFDKLKITFLGGQAGIGEKNMQVVEWQNDAIILDCGIDLSIDLPGVNYTIADTSYLEGIRHKLRAYVVSHGHLDHLGSLKHTVPKFPAPIYGSRFTIGVIEKTMNDYNAETGGTYEPKTVIMEMDNHERLKVGPFMIELVRITHSVPESSCIIVDTPVGRIINTGDWRLDPEPLDEKPTDVERLKELGKEGVLLLMSDSCNTQLPGRTPTESTLQESFLDVVGHAQGRVFVAIFSSNMNRVQMIVNAAVASGRRVALDGRSMMSYAEIAVRQGILKIPKGTVLSMREIANIPDDQVLVICTGGQGEPNAALQRMAEGNHKYIKLHPGDTVVVSSTPIPGNEIRYEEIGNELTQKGAFLYRHPTHEIDGVGPLHVSGHARRDEYRELLHIVKPKFFLPIYAGTLNRKRYQEMAIEEGWARKDTIMAANGDSILFTADKWEQGPVEPHGSVLVDQTGAVVSGVVVKDRIMLAEEGLVAVILTVDRKNGGLMTSPDIISRGFIYMRDSEELMNEFRTELRRAVSQRFKRVDLDRFKQELKEHVTHFLFDKTGRAPIVIPVVNVIGGGKPEGKPSTGGRPGPSNDPSGRPGPAPNRNQPRRPQADNHQPARPTSDQDPAEVISAEIRQSTEDQAAEQQKRFQEMRARLLGQDTRD